MSAHGKGHEQQQGQIGARRSARLSGTGASKSEYDQSRHPNDDQLPSSEDAVSSSGSEEALASRHRAKQARGQATAAASTIGLTSDDDSDDKPLKRSRPVKTKPEVATVESGLEDSDDDPIRPPLRKSAAKLRKPLIESDEDHAETDSDDKPLKPKRTGVRKAPTAQPSRDSSLSEIDSDEPLIPKWKGRSSPTRISKGKTKSVEKARGSRMRRRREIRDRDAFDLPDDFLQMDDYKAFAPSLTLPKTRQELRDLGMTNLWRLSQKLGELVIPNELGPRWDKAAYTINQVEQLPIQPNRDFECSRIECKKPARQFSYNAWLFTFRNKYDGSTFTLKAMNNLVEDVITSKKEAQQVGDRICGYLNRWPVPLPSDLSNEANLAPNKSPYFHFWPLMGFTAFFDVKPNHDNSVVPVLPKFLGLKGLDDLNNKNITQSVRVEFNKRWYATTYLHTSISEDWKEVHASGHTGVYIGIYADNIDPNVTIPDTPSWWPKESQDLRKVPEDRKSAVQRCIKLVHWLAFRLSGHVGDMPSQKRALALVKSPFMKDASIRRGNDLAGVYDGKNFLVWEVAFRNTHVLLSKHVAGKRYKDVSITIYGLSRIRLAFVKEAMTARFLAGYGVIGSIKHGSLVADLLNTGKISKEMVMRSVRSCEHKPHKGRPHVCQGCTRVLDCTDMVFTEEGYRVCQRCAKRTTQDEELKRGRRFNYTVRVNLRHDARKLGMSEETLWRHFKLIKEKFEEAFDSPTATYPDAFAPGKLRKETDESDTHLHTKRSSRITHPLQVTMDAVFPYHLDQEDDTLYYHHPDNVVTTAQWLNHMKHRWIPALLELIKEYRRLTSDLFVADEGPEIQDILRRLDHVYVLACVVPRSLKKRLRGSTKSEIVKLQRQMKSALADSTGMMPRLWKYAGRIYDSDWKPSRLEHIERIIKQMEQKYNRKVPRTGPQNVPWPWLLRHRIDAFNWRSLYQMMGDRLKRMDDWCDEEEEHFDESSETLLLECIRQFLELSGKDAFFGLPMTIWFNHPLCFAVAHLHHGMKMRTGFNTPEPTDFYEDYDESLSNISFEPQVSNFAKHNFPEDMYNMMLEDLTSVDISQEHYERSFKLPVPEIAQLSLLNDLQALDQDEANGPDSDDEWESGNELGEDEQDEADEGEVSEGKADAAEPSDEE